MVSPKFGSAIILVRFFMVNFFWFHVVMFKFGFVSLSNKKVWVCFILVSCKT